MEFNKLLFFPYFTRIDLFFPWVLVFPAEMKKLKTNSKISSDHKDAIIVLGS